MGTPNEIADFENQRMFIFIWMEVLQMISKKQKIFHFMDKLWLQNMAASSGLRENIYPINLLFKIFIFIILFLLLLISIGVKS